MTRLQVAIHNDGEETTESFALEAPDIATALTIADINLSRGAAEIWQGGQRLARLSRLGGDRTTYWRVT